MKPIIRISKTKRRTSRIPFCEWRTESMGHYNTGGIICANCNFHRTLLRGESLGDYQTDNKIDFGHNCPKCHAQNWYYLPPIARVPRKNASRKIWLSFWTKLKDREFNHPKGACR